MLPCHSCYIYATWRSKIWSHHKEGRGESHIDEIFLWEPQSYKKIPRELTTQLVYLNYLPISASFGVKIILHCKTYLLMKTS